jgi:hypothetical protein
MRFNGTIVAVLIIRKKIRYIHKYGIADDWYKYRYNSMKRIIIDWCESNNVDYMEK